jgi:hypothetical protein
MDLSPENFEETSFTYTCTKGMCKKEKTVSGEWFGTIGRTGTIDRVWNKNFANNDIQNIMPFTDIQNFKRP